MPLSHRTEAHAGLIQTTLAMIPDAIRSRAKKTAHAQEQDRPDILKARYAWFDDQFDFDPERLVFIDETWASTNMARRHGRAPRGERLRMSVSHDIGAPPPWSPACARMG